MNNLKFPSFLLHLTLVYSFLSLALLPAFVTSSSSSSSSSSSLHLRRNTQSQIQQQENEKEHHQQEATIPNVLTLSSGNHHVEDGRHLMQFWKVYAFVSGGHCPPGPLGEPCRKAQNSSSSSSGGSGSGSSSGGSSNGNGGKSSNGGSSSSSGGNSSNAASNGDYYGSSSSSSSSSSGGGGVGTRTTSMFSTKTGRASLITLVVGAALVAFGAAFIGMRSRNAGRGDGQHPLHGAIKKRSTLFTNLANRVNCAKGTKVCEGEYGQMV